MPLATALLAPLFVVTESCIIVTPALGALSRLLCLDNLVRQALVPKSLKGRAFCVKDITIEPVGAGFSIDFLVHAVLTGIWPVARRAASRAASGEISMQLPSRIGILRGTWSTTFVNYSSAFSILSSRTELTISAFSIIFSACFSLVGEITSPVFTFGTDLIEPSSRPSYPVKADLIANI